MLAYQAGLAKFEGHDAKVFGISTDNIPSLREFAEKLKVSFPLISDFKDRHVAKEYGVLMDSGVANRSTFVIGMDGKIEHIQEGSGAIDPTGAETACSRLSHKK